MFLEIFRNFVEQNVYKVWLSQILSYFPLEVIIYSKGGSNSWETNVTQTLRNITLRSSTKLSSG